MATVNPDGFFAPYWAQNWINYSSKQTAGGRGLARAQEIKEQPGGGSGASWHTISLFLFIIKDPKY